MNSLSLISIILREKLCRRPVKRQPEPSMAMDQVDQVAAYTMATRQFMAPTHLFHTAQAACLIRPGDRVLDLACGPATQLAEIAGVCSEADFVGVDLSDTMLEQADDCIRQAGLDNVVLHRGDITALPMIENQSIDVVVSSMSLHHLPQRAMLDATFKQIARVTKQDGGVYLADFGRMRCLSSMQAFAWHDAKTQPESFTNDYLHSLKAAFTVADFHRATKLLHVDVSVRQTFLVPFLLAVVTLQRRVITEELAERISERLNRLDAKARKDLRDMRRFFQLGGLDSPLLQSAGL